tara:strand:- start:223 stop:468 length:246 start_codon:yes stop_codon:yes gene_type:complete
MCDFHIGDLVEVKKSNDLSPTLRFFYNKKGMITKIISESHRSENLYMKEFEIMFSDGKRASFKDYELIMITKANLTKRKIK